MKNTIFLLAVFLYQTHAMSQQFLLKGKIVNHSKSPVEFVVAVY